MLKRQPFHAMQTDIISRFYYVSTIIFSFVSLQVLIYSRLIAPKSGANENILVRTSTSVVTSILYNIFVHYFGKALNKSNFKCWLPYVDDILFSIFFIDDLMMTILSLPPKKLHLL